MVEPTSDNRSGDQHEESAARKFEGASLFDCFKYTFEECPILLVTLIL